MAWFKKDDFDNCNWYVVPIRYRVDHTHITQTRYVVSAPTPKDALQRTVDVLNRKAPAVIARMLEAGPVLQVASYHDFKLFPLIALSDNVIQLTDLEREEG